MAFSFLFKKCTFNKKKNLFVKTKKSINKETIIHLIKYIYFFQNLNVFLPYKYLFSLQKN